MTQEEKNVILVPTDFTPVADCALDHAIEIAKLFDHKISLLHVVGKKTPKVARDQRLARLKKVAETNQSKTGIEITYQIEEGSIFDMISGTAHDLNADFIIMGIHGKQGVQHIVGSYAYKVICSSEVPVMVVKKKHHHVGYNNIVVPITFTSESAEKINAALRFAKYFDSVVHIIGLLRSKSSVFKIKKEALLKNVMDYIEKAGVKAKAEIIVKPGADLYDEVLSYSEKIDADLIMIVAERSGRFAEVLGKNDAEQIIDKAEIPVLTVIPDLEYDADHMLTTFFDPFGLIDK
ncbi:MAG: universal stress protein [Bacteroidetes bacterium]|nr:MAG: universal stress protein [Bacteroidota bacterium]